MLLNRQDSLNNYNRLFHISEVPDIPLFEPRPSPSHFDAITGNVVYAISGKLLHNYLLPRDCPRITYYLKDTTSGEDKERFFGESAADNIIIVESGWYHRIAKTTLYCYEFSADNFTLLDECAQYYISCKPEAPIKVTTVPDIMAELLNLNIELRFTPSLVNLAESVTKSSLSFSIIRMRNAKK